MNDRKFENLNPLDNDANSFLLSLYRWKAYVPLDRYGWLVLASVTLAIELYVVKVGLLVCESPFLVMYRKMGFFKLFVFFLKISPENKTNIFPTRSIFIIIH